MNSSLVIDFHAHYPKGVPDFPRGLVAGMDELGIDRVCLFSAGDALGHASNAEILAGAKSSGGRIIAFALIELGTDTPETVDACVRAGFRGFKITNPRSGYDDPRYFPIFQRMEQSGLPLLAHTGILMRFPQPPGMIVNSDWMRPIRLDAVLRSFPKLNIVGAHLGVPWHEEAAAMARMHPNYYVDLSGSNVNEGGWRGNKDAAFFRHLLFWEGAWDKVLFGTDILELSELKPAKKIHDRIIDSVQLPAETVRKIYGGTAARLLGL